MPVLYTMINFSDFKSMLVLIFADMRYKNNGVNNFAEAFARMIATINYVAIACFFEAICRGIFKHLLAGDSKNGGLLGLVSTYFGKLETNSRRMLHLHYLIWLCGIFHIFQLCNRLEADYEYAVYVVVFINCIIKCSIKPKDEANAPQPDTLSAFLDKSDSSFALKLDVDSNAVTMKFQIHLSTHKATCYKYSIAVTSWCRFDFLCSINKQTKITVQSKIKIFWNNV